MNAKKVFIILSCAFISVFLQKREAYANAHSFLVTVTGKVAGTTDPFYQFRNLSVTASNASYRKSQATNDEGIADFGSIPAGVYKIEIYSPGRFYYSKDGVSVFQNRLEAFALLVAPGTPVIPPIPLPTPEPWPAPVLNSVSPQPAFTGAPFTLTFSGSGFRSGSILEFSADNGITVGHAPNIFVNPQTVAINAPGDVPVGNYLARIKNSDGKSTVPINVSITNKTEDITPIINYLLNQ